MLRKTFASILCASLCAALSLGHSVRPAGSTVQDSLRLDVNLVNVFLTAQNSNGDYVTALAADDFHIYEDNVEQKISIFEKEDHVESAIGILVDNSGSMVDVLPIMKAGVLDFAQKSRRTDEFFVMSFGIQARVIHDVRQPIQYLDSAMKLLTPRGTSVLFDALLQAMTKVSGSERQRKALIVFTDGNDNGSKYGFGSVSLQAQRSNVLLYFVPIGPRVHIDQQTVESLATLSGGKAIYLEKTDPIRPVMESIRTDLAKQFYLGYYAPVRSGFHRLRVEVPGHDLRLRYKTGYMGG